VHAERSLLTSKHNALCQGWAQDRCSEETNRKATNLAAKHSNEAAESEAAKLVLFQELDAKREAWTVGSKLDIEKLLMEEGTKHAGLVESLKAKHLSE